jgi:hypothetical protein
VIREYLEQTVKNWAVLGHPAIMERFVLRNGKEFAPGPRLGHQGEPNACYSNATKWMLEPPWSPRNARYVEGFFLRKSLPIALQHAWVDLGDGKAMDPTVESEGNYYMGVSFDRKTLREQLRRNKVYGLLDHGHGINTDLIFRLDPELKPIVDEVIAAKRHFASSV